jgi:hypothetical protein
MKFGGRGWVSAVPRTQRAKSLVVVVLLPQRIVPTPPPAKDPLDIDRIDPLNAVAP